MITIKKSISLNVGKIPYGKKMTYDEAKAYAESQGMRLPTRTESLALIEEGPILSKDVVLPPSWWTCDEYSNLLKWRVCRDGEVRYGCVNDKYGVVPVVDAEN